MKNHVIKLMILVCIASCRYKDRNSNIFCSVGCFDFNKISKDEDTQKVKDEEDEEKSNSNSLKKVPDDFKKKASNSIKKHLSTDYDLVLQAYHLKTYSRFLTIIIDALTLIKQQLETEGIFIDKPSNDIFNDSLAVEKAEEILNKIHNYCCCDTKQFIYFKDFINSIHNNNNKKSARGRVRNLIETSDPTSVNPPPIPELITITGDTIPTAMVDSIVIFFGGGIGSFALMPAIYFCRKVFNKKKDTAISYFLAKSLYKLDDDSSFSQDIYKLKYFEKMITIDECKNMLAFALEAKAYISSKLIPLYDYHFHNKTYTQLFKEYFFRQKSENHNDPPPPYTPPPPPLK